MTTQDHKQIDWQAAVKAHQLDSHEPEEWLRYGTALLQVLKPGEHAHKQLQQAAIAFLQAQKENALQKDIDGAQRWSAIQFLNQALAAAEIIPPNTLLAAEARDAESINCTKQTLKIKHADNS